MVIKSKYLFLDEITQYCYHINKNGIDFIINQNMI